MLGCAGSQLGANLSKRVIKSNSRIASLGFQNNDRDTWWSSRREGTQLFQGKHFQFGYLHHARLHEHASRHRLNIYITPLDVRLRYISVNSRLPVSGRWLSLSFDAMGQPFDRPQPP
jgi:hypothetical protein